MATKRYIFSSLFILPLGLLAQMITPSVVATSGGFIKNTDYSISFTIGDFVVNTASDGNSIITQGFQQPLEIYVSVAENVNNNPGYFVYPNPFSDELKIQTLTGGEQAQVMIFDILGQQVGATQTMSFSQGQTMPLSTQELMSGVYVVRILSTDKSRSSEFKLTKL